MSLELEDVLYCAEECERQKSGIISVYNMCSALLFARIRQRVVGNISPQEIKDIGYLVDPENKGFRTIPVTISHRSIGWKYIERQIANLCIAQRDITPNEFYKEFEEIHPFKDGNGRVGSILWNWVNHSLDKPVAPTDIFKKEQK